MAVFGTRALVLEIATAATPTTFVDFTSSVSNVRITSAESDSDFVSFADAAAGGARDYALAMTLVQDNATTSLWYKTFNETGTDCPVRVWPAGKPSGGTPSATQPRFAFTATVREPDGDWIGGEADASTTARFLTEVEWPLLAKPSLAVS